MVTKRTPIKRDNVVRITPQVITTWTIIRETFGDDARESEFIEASQRLDELLDREPWQEAIESTINEDLPPDYIVKAGDYRFCLWTNAHAIRVQLDEALKRGALSLP